MNNGWIKLHRQLLDWEWYSDINVCRLFTHCLLKANHKPKKWQGITIESGSFISSRDILSTETGLTVQQIRTAINKLKSTSELTIKTTNKFTVFSITCWESYQIDNQQDNQQVTSEQPTNNQQVTTNKNVNKVNKERKAFAPPSVIQIKEYILEKGYSINAEQFFSYYESNNWMVGRTKMKKWKAAITSWQTRENKNKPQQQAGAGNWELGSQ